MGHSVVFAEFDDFKLLTYQEVVDLIDTFYRWDDAEFRIVGRDSHKGRRGSHIYNGLERVHVITLSRPNIEAGVRAGQRMGGNGRAPNARIGAAMVLTHELQHANQSKLHSNNEIFYRTKKYNKRPCEREARQFVDDNLATIAAVMGVDVPSVPKRRSAMEAQVDPVQEVAELLGECEEVSVGDIVDELRRAGLVNPQNVARTRQLLQERGVRILTPCDNGRAA